jgi:hypothetical protein
MREVQHFVYCIEARQAGFAKVGASSNPRSRFQYMRAQAPFEMRFRHVVKLATRPEADAWERHILATADRYRDHGEWVIANAKLDGLFLEVLPCEVVTWAFQTNASQGRIIAKGDTMLQVRQAKLKAIGGAGVCTALGYDGNAEGETAAIIHARLGQGYGVEDIHAIDGLPLSDIRAEISKLTEDGKLRRVLGLSPTPTEARA